MKGYNLESLNDIKTVVFLSPNDSEATDMNNAIIKVLKCGLNDKINLMDFSQYDFSYISTKGNFNSEFVINQLDNSSKLLLGDGENDISIVEKILFPTLSSEIDSNNINEYFGYILLNNYKFSLLEVPKNTEYVLLLDKWQTREDILNKYIYSEKSTVIVNDVEYTFVSGLSSKNIYKYYKKYEYINKLRYEKTNSSGSISTDFITIYNKFIIGDTEYYHGRNSISGQQFVASNNSSNGYTINSNDYFTIKEVSNNIYFSCKLDRDNWKVEWVDKINNLNGSSDIVQKVTIGTVEYTITNDHLVSASGTQIAINKIGYTFVPKDFPSIEFNKSNINQRRAISLYFPESGKDSLGINVMYQSYLLDNTNPNRNANEIYLRNDDFYKEISDINIISEQSYGDKKFYYNKSTGTLLGNKKNSEDLIIFNSKKPNDTDKKFNPKVRYNLGDIVEIDSVEWISLSNNNIGNVPSCSSNWTKRSTYESILLNKVKVSLDLDIDESVSIFNRDFSKYDLGNINKSGIITVENDLKLSWDLENRFKYSHIELDGEILKDSATITGNTATIDKDNLTDVNNCSVVVKPKEVILKISIDNLDTDKLSGTIKINNIILNLNNNDNVNIIDKTLEISKIFPKDIITISNSELIIDGFDVCVLSKLKDNSGYEIIVPENIRFDSSSSIIIEGSISYKINKVVKLESEISNLIFDNREYIGKDSKCYFNFYIDGDTTIDLDNLTTNFNFYKNGEPVNFTITSNKDKLTNSDESISIEENSNDTFKLTAIVGEEDITIKIEKK